MPERNCKIRYVTQDLRLHRNRLRRPLGVLETREGAHNDTQGISMIWNRFKDEWLITKQAAKLFLVSTFLVLALTPAFLGKIHTDKMPLWERLPWAILGVLGPVALFFLWLGMWRYWVRIDCSNPWAKRMWFIVLLIGFWWGSCL